MSFAGIAASSAGDYRLQLQPPALRHRWSLLTAHCSLVTGHCSLVTGHQSLVIDLWYLAFVGAEHQIVAWRLSYACTYPVNTYFVGSAQVFDEANSQRKASNVGKVGRRLHAG